jgi:hypothetical protein
VGTWTVPLELGTGAPEGTAPEGTIPEGTYGLPTTTGTEAEGFTMVVKADVCAPPAGPVGWAPPAVPVGRGAPADPVGWAPPETGQTVVPMATISVVTWGPAGQLVTVGAHEVIV